MKDMAKRALALIAALTLALPCLALPAAAEKEDGTVEEQTQPLTVVAKRITNDDTYFEISLEVNEDYDKYSSVGVVLRYDPTYITPADSWAEDAPAADMSENTSWATRRALPTLGVDTWTTHTALAYEETAPQDGADKPYGYLYLGAEHPRPEEGPNPDATVEPEPELEPKLGEPDSEPDPDAAPKPETGTAPVVAARFVYNAKGEKTGEDVRKDLENAWLKGTNTTESIVKDHPTNWDYDWYANDILTIAKDEVAQESPAQYPFVIYTQNYEEKAFMHKFPETVMTSAELRSVDEYKHVVGSNITTENKLNATDISIITLVGDSALKTGGLSLSDIYTILFFDWDDSLIGAVTAGRGEEGMNKTVSEYVRATMVHPDLRDNENYESLERSDTYRGEYPESGPDGGTPTAKSGKYGDGAEEPGSKYPITNKLDYVFAGKDFYEDAPYAGGWTRVDTDAMSDTYTWFNTEEMDAGAYGKAVETDENGIPLGDDGSPDSSIPIPDMISCDFDNIDIKDGETTVIVKAVYRAGTKLNDGDPMYISDEEKASYSMLSSLTELDNRTYGISFNYFRINQYGYGVKRAKQPKVRMDITQKGASGSTSMQVDVENGECIPVMLTPTNQVETTSCQLIDTYTYNIITGLEESQVSAVPFQTSDFKDKTEYNYFISEIYNYSIGEADTVTAQIDDLVAYGFKMKYTKPSGTKPQGTVTEIKTNANRNNVIKYVGYYINEAISRGEMSKPEDLTWAQIQYAILTCTTAAKAKSGYKNAAECAELFTTDGNADLTTHYPWVKPYEWMK